VVTASVDNLAFLHPVKIGELIILRAAVNRVFRTSMEIGVKVMTEKLLTGERRHTCSAYLTFVAINPQGKAIPIEPVIPESEDEKRRYRQAGDRRQARLDLRNKLRAEG
jgi:acyl-CoA hydrolase